MKKLMLFFFLIILGSNIPQHSEARTDHEKLFRFLQEAYTAQLLLTEEVRTIDEVNAVLSPYFTKNFTEMFLNEHLFQEDDGFIVYGTDVLNYVIPFYSYDDTTKVVKKDKKIIVYEYFPGPFWGPVIGEGQYEAIHITMLEDGSWKVSDFVRAEQLSKVIK